MYWGRKRKRRRLLGLCASGSVKFLHTCRIRLCLCMYIYYILFTPFAIMRSLHRLEIPTFFKQGERGQTVLRMVEQTYSATNRTLFPSRPFAIPHFTLHKHTHSYPHSRTYSLTYTFPYSTTPIWQPSPSLSLNKHTISDMVANIC